VLVIFLSAAIAYDSLSEAILRRLSNPTLVRKRDELVSRIRESRRQRDESDCSEYDDESLDVRFDELKKRARGEGESNQ